VVVPRDDERGGTQLVAYVVPREASEEAQPSVSSLRRHLKEFLPDHMVPSAFVVLRSLPLGPNGKLNRRALPAPDSGAQFGGQYEAPQGEVEVILAGIWAEVLRVDKVDRRDDFFELGGHSLLMLRVVTRVREAFGIEVPVSMLFTSPTPMAFASDVRHLLTDGTIQDNEDEEYESGVIE